MSISTKHTIGLLWDLVNIFAKSAQRLSKVADPSEIIFLAFDLRLQSWVEDDSAR